jgi:hypothetical protein
MLLLNCLTRFRYLQSNGDTTVWYKYHASRSYLENAEQQYENVSIFYFAMSSMAHMICN